MVIAELGPIHHRSARELVVTSSSVRKQSFLRLVLYVPLVIWAAITIYPFIFVGLLSLRSLDDFFARPFAIPDSWEFSNYSEAWATADMPTLTVNSLFVAALATIIVLITCAPAAYALIRFKFRLRPLLWAYLMVGLFVPDVTRLVPTVIITRWLHLYDSLIGLALVYAAAGVPFTILLLAAYMSALPVQLEEAALVDGGSQWTAFREVAVPLSTPVLVMAATFQWLTSWNEFLLARLLLDEHRTLPMGMAAIVGQYSAGLTSFAAAIVIALGPAIVVFVLLQRYVVAGIGEGALRG